MITSADCAMCGQGLIYPVEITADGGSRFSLCCECERMWKADDPIEPEQAVDFIAYMEERNLDAVWSNLRVLGPPLLKNSLYPNVGSGDENSRL